MRLPTPDRSCAVLIGTGTYRSPAIPNVPQVANNLAEMAAVLTDPKLGGLLPHRCITIQDPADGLAVAQLLNRYCASTEDTLIVYYTGHGLLHPSRGELFLGLPGTDHQALRVSALPFEAVREALAESPAANRVLILDCCYSGTVTLEHQGLDDDLILAQIGVAGTYTLAAAPANTIAVYEHGAPHTAFTQLLIATLRAGTPGGPELLTLGTIYRHLVRAAMASGLPTPQQRGTGTTEYLALARNAAHDPRLLTVAAQVQAHIEPAPTAQPSDITDPWAQIEAMQAVASMVSGPGVSLAVLDQAVQLASRVTRDSTRDQMLVTIIKTLAEHDPAYARRLAVAITDIPRRRTALQAIVQALAAQSLDEAHEVLNEIAMLDAADPSTGNPAHQ